MFIRQIKRKCNVRGCKCTDSFAISQTREVGNTVIICENCLKNALGAIGEIDPKKKSNIPEIDNTSSPALFFNAKARGMDTEANTDDILAVPETEVLTGSEEVTCFACPVCEKEFDSERGLNAHLRHCKKQNDEGTEL